MSDETVERYCEVMHDAYEAAALGAGWETQERSRKPWADVPEANKRTMRAAVRALLAAVAEDDNASSETASQLERQADAPSQLCDVCGRHHPGPGTPGVCDR